MFKRFTTGFAVGYVLGSKAGDKRYKQICDLADRAMEWPVVKDVAQRAQETATRENGRRLFEGLKERLSGSGSEPEESRDYDDFEAEEDDEEQDDPRDETDDLDDDFDDEDDDEEQDDPRDETEDFDDDDFEDEGEDEPQEADDGDGGRPDRSSGRDTRRHRPPRKRSGRIANLANAARERGRVD